MDIDNWFNTILQAVLSGDNEANQEAFIVGYFSLLRTNGILLSDEVSSCTGYENFGGKMLSYIDNLFFNCIDVLSYFFKNYVYYYRT